MLPMITDRLNQNPLHLIHRDLVIPPIIQRRRPRRLMRRHLLRQIAPPAKYCGKPRDLTKAKWIAVLLFQAKRSPFYRGRVLMGAPMKKPWLIVSVIALILSVSSLACRLSFESVNLSSSEAEALLSGVVYNPKSTVQDLAAARARLAKISSIQGDLQSIWLFGAYIGLLISVVALFGREQTWHSKPIPPIVAFYSSVAAVMTTMPLLLFFVSLQLFGPMH